VSSLHISGLDRVRSDPGRVWYAAEVRSQAARQKFLAGYWGHVWSYQLSDARPRIVRSGIPRLGRSSQVGMMISHLVCRYGGRTIEVEGPAIERWTDRIAAEQGFSDVQHHLEVFGRCSNCAA
jgi:Ferric uptake regulator family